MSGIFILIATVAFIVALTTLPVLGLIWLDEWQQRRRFDAHVEQAVAVVDDGKALVRETEDFLRWRSA